MMAAAKKKNTTKRGRHTKGGTIDFGSRTDVGLVRERNEDSLTVTPPLFAVADGMGGHAAGEVASEVAIQALQRYAPDTADSDDLARAVVEANRAVIRAAREGLGRRGMGTTMTAAILEGLRLVIAQVGDSRAYLLHEDHLQLITHDHSLVAELVDSGQITPEEAKTHPQRSVITRALGSDPNTLPDIYEISVEEGDRLLLCSDGLSGMVDEDVLESTLIQVNSPQKCADALVEAALAAGGHDNVTAIVVDVPTNTEKRVAKARRHGRLAAFVGALALVAIIAIAIVGGGAYLHHTAFLTIQDDDQIVICRGLPGTFLGIQTWQLERETGYTPEDLDLPTSTIERLEEGGIQTDSVDDAEALLETWEDQAQAQEESDEAEGDVNSSSQTTDSTNSTNDSDSDSSSSAGDGDNS